jgi:hypothetical protein
VSGIASRFTLVSLSIVLMSALPTIALSEPPIGPGPGAPLPRGAAKSLDARPVAPPSTGPTRPAVRWWSESSASGRGGFSPTTSITMDSSHAAR